MDIRQLQDFVAVVDHGTMTAAAEALHISQPPLSAQIKLLEEELNCTLFDRSTRRMELTEAGRILYTRASSILDLCTSTQHEMADFRTGGTGTLRLGIVSSVANTLCIRWLKAFHRTHPDVRFELTEGNTYRMLDAVNSGQVELALVRQPFSVGDLSSIMLQEDPLCVIGEKKFLTKGSSIPLRAVADVPLLIYRRWEPILREAFEKQGMHPTVLCAADDARTVIRLAEEGMGVGIMPRSALPEKCSLRTPSIEKPAIHTDLCAVCRRDSYMSAAAKQFLAMIRE